MFYEFLPGRVIYLIAFTAVTVSIFTAFSQSADKAEHNPDLLIRRPSPLVWKNLNEFDWSLLYVACGPLNIGVLASVFLIRANIRYDRDFARYFSWSTWFWIAFGMSVAAAIALVWAKRGRVSTLILAIKSLAVTLFGFTVVAGILHWWLSAPQYLIYMMFATMYAAPFIVLSLVYAISLVRLTSLKRNPATTRDAGIAA